MISKKELLKTLGFKTLSKFESEQQAVEFLEVHGFKLARDFTWTHELRPHGPTVRELAALIYLQAEWGYGDLKND